MKKWLLSTTAAACLLAGAPSAFAGDGLWHGHTPAGGAPAASTPVSGDTAGTADHDGSATRPVWLHIPGLLRPHSAPTSDAETTEGPSQHAPDIHSSVQLSRNTLREAYLASREAYTSKLQRYAKVTAKQAKKAVMAAHPGMKVEDVQLRNIRTNLVYMAIAEDNEDKFFVVVDAGNGKVLMDRPLPTHHERVFSGH